MSCTGERVLAQVTAEPSRQVFLRLCEGSDCFGPLLAGNLELFAKGQPGRFFVGQGFALDIGAGAEPVGIGRPDAELLTNCLRLSGKHSVVLDGSAPAGWAQLRQEHRFVLEAGRALPLPTADAALWESLALNRTPSPYKVVGFVQGGAGWEDAYAELCTRLNHGMARLWALEREGQILCTVRAALWDGRAYLDCGMTCPELRGRGVGGRLIVQAANELAAQGLRVSFRCLEERVHFYTRLGFLEQTPVGCWQLPDSEQME